MRFLPFIFLILFVSGCVSQGSNVLEQLFKMDSIKSDVEDIEVIGNIPEFVIEGVKFPFYAEITAKNDISDVNFEIYDKCTAFLSTDEPYSAVYPSIETDRTKSFSSHYTAGDVVNNVDDCKINYKINYTSSFSLSQQIIAMPYEKLEQMTTDGTLESVNPSSSKTSNPLLIKISFSQDQPFTEANEVIMYIDYETRGVGKIDKISSGDIEITFPAEIMDVTDDCQGFYTKTPGVLTLSKDIEFVDGKGPKTSCQLKINKIDKTGRISLTASYGYRAFGELGPIEVRKK